MPDLRLEVIQSIHQVPAAQWDGCAGADNPFVEHRFLATLEDAGCLGPASGWIPQYLIARPSPDADPVGIAPLFVKTDSYGEYIFDWAWAQGAQRAGLPYYPKITVAVPFTPATGPRLLLAEHADRRATVDALAGGAMAVAQRIKASGVHWLFCTETEADALEQRRFLHRRTHQFHWTNAGYRDFEDFLDHLVRKRRKEVRRERRKAQSHGLDIVLKTGAELTEADWRGLERFYDATHAVRPYQRKYLTPQWWRLAPQRLADRAVAVLAYDGGQPVAGSLSMRKGPHLYGRYWGCLRDYDAVHFEACYYRLIEFAIDEGITLFEAGAQGGHKLARGLLPAITHSAHFLTHPGLHEAIGRFVEEESGAVLAEMDAIADLGPFKARPPAEADRK